MKSIQKLRLRKVLPDDLDLLYKWANDSTVRQNAIDSSPIPYNGHVEWFNLKMSSNKCLIWIGIAAHTPCGQVRADFDKNDDAWISYSVDEAFRGRGVGTALIKELLHQPEIIKRAKTLRAIVKSSNLPSIKIFNSFGFELKECKQSLLYFQRKLGHEHGDPVNNLS